MYYENGDKYDGEFKNDKRDGKGKMIFKDKKEEFEGEWENDIEKKRIMNYENGEHFKKNSNSNNE